MTRRFFKWIFNDELTTLENDSDMLRAKLNKLNSTLLNAERITSELNNQMEALNRLLNGIDVSIDVHEYDCSYSPSWAVISLQGQKSDYIKFVSLGESEILEISRFISHFERQANVKVDASPIASDFLRVKKIRNK
jgi:hypothetical protein